MHKLRYNLRTDGVFYLLIIGYAYLILNMSLRLWFGEGINIFATYSTAASLADMLVDANKVYWSKTCFLFLTLFLYFLNFDYRFAAGVGASFWSISLILMFGPSPVLLGVAGIGLALLAQQLLRKQVRTPREAVVA
ncbi:MAG: hypothetical protein AAFR61_31470 [Bacteroidota bacterium]